MSKKQPASWLVFEDQFNLAGAICQRPTFRTTPNLWETPGRMKREDCLTRFEQAASLCQRCPALDECRRRRDTLAEAGFAIDGVVAGDIPLEYSTHCRGCGVKLVTTKQKPPAGVKRHWRAGYCRKCYEALRKTARK